MWRIVFGVFLIMHGITHAFVREGGSWLLGQSGDTALQSVSVALTGLTVLAYAVAGLAELARRRWWQEATLAATVVSMVLLGLFWNGASLIGLPIDLAILTGLLWEHRVAAEA